MSTPHDSRPGFPGASFEEKSVWLQLTATVLALGAYFVIAGRMMSAGVNQLAAYVPLFIAAVVVQVVVLIAGHAAAAVLSRPEPRDERDRLIGWRAESNSGWVLATGVLAAITALVFSLEAVWVAHLLLGSLLLSQVLSFVLQLVYYRRGV